jgi:hypothetical protein
VSKETGGAINHSTPSVTECLFVENSASQGGGVSLYGVSPTISSSTFFDNSAPSGGGILCYEFASPRVENCVIAFSTQGEAFHCLDPRHSSFLLSCCDLYGNAGGDWVGVRLEDQLGINGNISADPLFCNADAGDFYLGEASPCAPAHNPECGLIGAWRVGCTIASVSGKIETITWSGIKAMYR